MDFQGKRMTVKLKRPSHQRSFGTYAKEVRILLEKRDFRSSSLCVQGSELIFEVKCVTRFDRGMGVEFP